MWHMSLHMPHSVSTTDSPSFFQLVLFLAAAAASPQDLSPADAIFLVWAAVLACVLLAEELSVDEFL